MHDTKNSRKIRTRFAPSPTGYLHVGSLRTALYCYLFTRKQGGEFLLRVEDTDRSRFVPGAVESLIGTLGTLGLEYDEGVFSASQGSPSSHGSTAAESVAYPGVIEVGDSGPYVQSERLELYGKYAEQLIADGKAYRCFCTSERLDAMRAEQQAAKQMPKYDRHCLHLSADEVREKLAAGAPSVVRLRLPDAVEVAFDDLVRGTVSFKTETMDDQILMKSDGYPTYHLAVVVDDHLMGVTHVIRAEEWLPSTPKHILLYQAFGWGAPAFAHLPLLLNPDRSKLSKRQGDVAVEDYLKKGYLTEALINFVALLGWNPGEGSTQEIFTKDELVQCFDLGHVHKGGAVFDIKKLDWLNAQYIKALTLDRLLEKSLPFFSQKNFFQSAGEYRQSPEYLYRVLTVEQERLTRLDEVGEQNPFFFQSPIVDAVMLPWKGNDAATTKASLETSQMVLAGIPDAEWSREGLSEKLLEAAGDKKGDLLWPLRVALTGAKYSPSPSDVAWVLGPDESLSRIAAAIVQLT